MHSIYSDVLAVNANTKLEGIYSQQQSQHNPLNTSDGLHSILSIRAFRGLRYNASYAAKLEKKRARQQEKEASRAKALLEEEKRKQAAKVNPFSVRVIPLLNQVVATRYYK